MDQIMSLIFISSVLLIAILGLYISKKTKISSIIILIILGQFLQIIINELGFRRFYPDNQFLFSLSLFGLVIILFYHGRNINIKNIDTNNKEANILFFLFLVLNILILPFLILIFLNLDILTSLLFTILVSSALFSINKIKGEYSNKINEILKYESDISIIVTAFLFMFVFDLILNNRYSEFFVYLYDIILALGFGIIAGIIILRYKKTHYFRESKHILAYVGLAACFFVVEWLGSNGIYSVITYSIFIGNTIKVNNMEIFDKRMLLLIKSAFLIIIGFLFIPYFSLKFLGISIILFLIFILIRYICVKIIFYYDKLNKKEIISMVFSMHYGMLLSIMLIFLISAEFKVNDLLVLSVLFLIYGSLSQKFFQNSFIDVKNLKEPNEKNIS